jgi:hypothetical protein
VADAGFSGKRGGGEEFFEVGEFSFGAAAGDLASGGDGDAGGVIAAVFQLFQPIQKEGTGVTDTGNADNAAHKA